MSRCSHGRTWPRRARFAPTPSRSSPEEVIHSPKVKEFVRARFAEHNANCGGSSGRIKRVMLMLEPPSVDGHEITDKGYINQRATLDRRNELVDLLYVNTPPEDVIEIARRIARMREGRPSWHAHSDRIALVCSSCRACAGEIRFPESGNPAITADIPDSWRTQMRDDGYLHISSIDRTLEILFSIVPFTGRWTMRQRWP